MTDEELTAYEADEANYGVIEFRGKKNPANHWAAPFVTGHTYYLRWSYGLDFEQMRFEIVEPLWDNDLDKDILLEIPFYDVREAIHVDASDGERVVNKTLSTGREYNKFGANLVYNETFEDDDDIPNQERRLIMAISASNANNDRAVDGVTYVDLTGVRPDV